MVKTLVRGRSYSLVQHKTSGDVWAVENSTGHMSVALPEADVAAIKVDPSLMVGLDYVAPTPKRGRPVGTGNDLIEASVLVTGPAELLALVRDAAEREGVPVREWWRRAAQERLAK